MIDLVDVMHLRARTDDPHTSHAQLKKLSMKAGTMAYLILELLRKNPRGLNTKEMADISKQSRVSISPMMKPMEHAGHVVRTDEVRDRGIVWKIAMRDINCPKCGIGQDDHDGFGFVFCEACRYCTHASVTGSTCDFCGSAQ